MEFIKTQKSSRKVTKMVKRKKCHNQDIKFTHLNFRVFKSKIHYQRFIDNCFTFVEIFNLRLTQNLSFIFIFCISGGSRLLGQQVALQVHLPRHNLPYCWIRLISLDSDMAVQNEEVLKYNLLLFCL